MRASTVFGWLLVFVAAQWAAYKFAGYGPVSAPSELFDIFSVLEIIELALIWRLFDHKAALPQISALEGVALLFASTTVMIAGARKPMLAAAAISFIVFARFSLIPAFRLAAAAQLAFIAQFALLGWPFLQFHNFVGRIDGFFVRAFFRAKSVDIAGAGTYVLRPAQNIGFDIMWGCATTTTLIPNLFGFFIITLGMRRRLVKTDIVWAVLIAISTAPLNWLRLLLICRNNDSYVFWHEGTGAAIFAALYAGLVLGAVHSALRTGERP
ncbi:MAG: hypothetical protein KGL46_10040 [Hyphomicrobiales bacterium]|nr:hypothetical protein [Hyphomicrobiales bacterium]